MRLMQRWRLSNVGKAQTRNAERRSGVLAITTAHTPFAW